MPISQRHPCLCRGFVYVLLGLLFASFFLTLSHTVLRRSVEGEERVFDNSSCFDSHDSEISEVIGAAAKEAKNALADVPHITEAERRKARIERHPLSIELIQQEAQSGTAMFSVPVENRISLDEAVALYEKRMKQLRCFPRQRENSILFALKMQATVGDNRTLRPWIFNYTAYLEWRAWRSLKGRDHEFCKRKYVKFMKMLIFKYGLRPRKNN